MIATLSGSCMKSTCLHEDDGGSLVGNPHGSDANFVKERAKVSARASHGIRVSTEMSRNHHSSKSTLEKGHLEKERETHPARTQKDQMARS